MRIQQVMKFIGIYKPTLLECIRSYPNKYTYGEDSLDQVTENMSSAFLDNCYNTDGIAIRHTCKALGIKHAHRAMEKFFNGN